MERPLKRTKLRAKPELEVGEEGENIAPLKSWRLRRMPFSPPASSPKLHVYTPATANRLLNVDLKASRGVKESRHLRPVLLRDIMHRGSSG